MWPTGASSLKEAMIIGTEIYHTLKCPHCTLVCAKPKEYTHVSSRGTVRTLPGLCLLSPPIQWSFRACLKLFCALRLDSLDSLHASVPEKGLEAHETGDLQMNGLIGALAIQIDLSCSSVELHMQSFSGTSMNGVLSDWRNALCCSWSQEKPQ